MDDKTFLSPEVTQHGGHMIMQNVKKPNKIKYLNIDTRFQGDYNSSKLATLTYNLPQKITEVKSIAVRNIEIPMSFYSFSSNRGNTHMKVHSSNANTDTNIVINDYSYHSYNTPTHTNEDVLPLSVSSGYEVQITQNTNLITEINSKLSVFGIDDIVSDPGPNFLSINSTGNICSLRNYSNLNGNDTTYTIHFDVDISGGFNKYNFKSTLGWCLGFRQQSYTLAPGETIVAEGMIDRNNIRYLYLVVDEFRQSNPNSFLSPLHNSFISKNILARITLNTEIYPFGSILPANIFNGLLLSDQRYYSGKTDIQKLQIQLIDDWGNIVDLNQMDFSFCLEIEYE